MLKMASFVRVGITIQAARNSLWCRAEEGMLGFFTQECVTEHNERVSQAACSEAMSSEALTDLVHFSHCTPGDQGGCTVHTLLAALCSALYIVALSEPAPVLSLVFRYSEQTGAPKCSSVLLVTKPLKLAKTAKKLSFKTSPGRNSQVESLSQDRGWHVICFTGTTP